MILHPLQEGWKCGAGQALGWYSVCLHGCCAFDVVKAGVRRRLPILSGGGRMLMVVPG